jgi:hypothetical protein
MTKLVEPEKDGQRRQEPLTEAHDKSIWEVIDEIMRAVPEETLRHGPVDGAEQHDHYLYGTPKRTPHAS